MQEMINIAVVGGGASGFFAAIQAAEKAKENGGSYKIKIFEASARFLSKVKISGGGRCNVTHHQYDPSIFCKNYPRGSRELRSPFTQFQAADTVEWFRQKGVKLVAEEDGRMFPSTNDSATVIECFVKTALNLGVELKSKSAVQSISRSESEKFLLKIKDQADFKADKVLIATGSSKAGYEMAKELGHTITELAPSLFSFKVKHALLRGLPGTSFPNVKLSLKADGKSFAQAGPLLITHRGLSGPAVLKLSAWAAREMKRRSYRADLKINWAAFESHDQARESYETIKTLASKTMVKNASPDYLTRRFWHSFLAYLEISGDKKWGEISKKELNRLIENTFAMPVKIDGQNRFKEEFVECGGIKLSEVNLKTMESKIAPGLFFSGEILDVDGVTGGFNFQNAWTSGYIAGSRMASV